MIHTLKLLSVYAIPKLSGDKSFEIRLNDRHFSVGDYVRYVCPDNRYIDYLLSFKLYKIVYMCDYAQRDNYVVFSDCEV